jgi:hypothetical protein
MDILGPLLKAMGNRQFILIAINYFTKKVKVEALANISFIWKNIIYRFGIIRTLIIDNGTQFNNHKMKEQC